MPLTNFAPPTPKSRSLATQSNPSPNSKPNPPKPKAGSNKPASTFSSVVGCVPPGTTPGPGQTPLPIDLEQAAVEQVAYWFQIRDKLGLKTRWLHAGTYEGLLPLDLLPNVQTTLKRYQR